MKGFKLILPASLNYSESVRMLSMEVVDDAGSFSKREKNMVRLVIDEIFMNSVKYGSNKGSVILIEGGFEMGNVLFAIEDEGKGSKKVSAEELSQIIQDEKENVDLKKTHGRGLAQITGVMTTEFNVLDGEMGGIRIEFSKKASGENENQVAKGAKGKFGLKKKDLQIKEEKVFALSGNIDLYNIDAVSEPIDQFISEIDGAARVIFDCKDLEYFNSTFIGNLAHWYSIIDENGGEAVLRHASHEVFEILDLVGMSDLIKIEEELIQK